MCRRISSLALHRHWVNISVAIKSEISYLDVKNYVLVFFKCLELPLSHNELRDATILQAIDYYENHGRTASRWKVVLHYRLHPSPLLRCIQGKTQSTLHGSQNRILSSIQEAAIPEYIYRQYGVGFLCTIEMIMEATAWFREQDSKPQPLDTWVKGFMKEHRPKGKRCLRRLNGSL